MTVVLDTLSKIGFMFALIMGMVVVLIWMERKGAAFIQDRTGPNRADILGVRLAGLVHPLADVFKLLFKEDVTPVNRHKALYNLAPMLAMIVAMATYTVIPFGDYLNVGGRTVPLVVADLDVGLLYILAIASLGTYAVVMAGWAANNKFTFLGGIRATAQMISYELSMGLALMGLVLIFGSLRLTDIAAGQAHLIWGFLPKWGVVVQPLGFLIFITAVYAETNRNPFDLPEGESEIVAGFHLEYSSMKFALFFMAEYAHMVVGAALISTFYFGGYQIPFMPRPYLEAHAGQLVTGGLVATALVSFLFALLFFRRVQREKNKFGDARDREPGLGLGLWLLVGLGCVAALGLRPWGMGPEAASVAASLLQVSTFVTKVVFFAWLFIWVRWTLPRFRFDQLMHLGWKALLPLAIANLVVTALVSAFV
ncbi:NADH-quinone oxidoreductase subunit H [bacterium DOLJORAL78_65_58]|nr:MAG: NADH-quinone oxidoreductase subunit H [bacterium DOLZORAL124_64_63]PIE75975.1 MAG: NADH-quinone oxidoreductase subunit H [bacterium DOLJORAL78_65_58]